ncbi:MAG: hypothetical protein WKF35_08965 [Ferruginibacter sp.]
MTHLEQYLEKTGQTMQDLFAGASQVGVGFVFDLIPKALEENKIIVWVTHNEFLGSGVYELQDPL